ncbi:SDR family oxidoreductase [Halomonas sp. MCCC 1A11036]|uniref:SDR family oxidoreductase n=1 Tax=Billgrantia zhangzhouensis TaxID=2733481 RepID=A0ABS9AJY2_9GAMM|nr:SDR family oxidoreductase [Halomonas zhangzhouensis]MCE8021967.1 SDR family oxidoreductase [Halomonas zhangzhouensis]
MGKPILVVTGGGRGIGRAVCRLGAERGYAVIFSYRDDVSAARSLVEEIEAAGGSARGLCLDMAEADAAPKLFACVDEQPGELAGVVNNAGVTGGRGDFMSSDPAVVRRVFDVNVFGLMECCRQAVLRLSVRHGGMGGAIVNLSSGAAGHGAAHSYVWYAASKAAVEAFTLGLAREVGQEGIRVNAVSPGVTDTGIHAHSDRDALIATIPLRRMARPEEIAEAVLWLISDSASYVAGSVMRVGGGR